MLPLPVRLGSYQTTGCDDKAPRARGGSVRLMTPRRLAVCRPAGLTTDTISLRRDSGDRSDARERPQTKADGVDAAARSLACGIVRSRARTTGRVGPD